MEQMDIRIIPWSSRNQAVLNAREEMESTITGEFMSEFNDLIRQPVADAANAPVFSADRDDMIASINEGTANAMNAMTNDQLLAIKEYSCGNLNLAMSQGIKIEPVYCSPSIGVAVIRVTLPSTEYLMKI